MQEIINQWASDYSVPLHAINDLMERMVNYAVPDQPIQIGKSEKSGQQQIRLEASRRNTRLMRNNNGQCVDQKGHIIRFGLANESKAINKKVKSSDLIGITPVLIRPEHVNTTMGIFTAYECKKSDWLYTGTDREVAQLNFIQIVLLLGGFAQFARSPSDIWPDV